MVRDHKDLGSDVKRRLRVQDLGQEMQKPKSLPIAWSNVGLQRVDIGFIKGGESNGK